MYDQNGKLRSNRFAITNNGIFVFKPKNVFRLSTQKIDLFSCKYKIEYLKLHKYDTSI